VTLKYRIGSLGWYNFETLVQTLLKGLIGSGVTSFGGTKDSGRDATFNGTASFPSGQTRWQGYWVFQVKYADFEEQGVRTARTELKNTFRKELNSLLTRHQTRPDNYILITNIPLTAGNRDELKVVVQQGAFQGNFCSIDGKEMCQFLDLFPQVRRSYPQLLGLADLDKIVNHELYERSEAYVQQWQPRLATFVCTPQYGDAITTLKNHHFVVLDGPPETGKSTIAAALALMYAADGFEIVDVRDPSQIFKVYNQDCPQLFVADDAVGSISFSPSLTDQWSRDLPGILKKLNAKHLLIWTARRYVLEEAICESRLGEAIRDFPGASEVLVEVGKLSSLQKAEILYNHAKKAHLSKAARTLIRAHAVEIANHPNFTPERIRQLVENVLPKPDGAGQREDKTPTWKDVQEFLKNPGVRWVQAYSKLNESEQMLLVAMLDLNALASSTDVKRAYELHCEQLSGRRLDFDDCVNRLEHSFVTVIPLYSKHSYIDFQHPSLRDMLLSQLRNNEVARRRYVQLASPLGLSQLIKGVAVSLGREGEDNHVLSLKSEGEVSVLIQRLAEVSSGILPPNDWHAILSATDLLLPRKSSEIGRINKTASIVRPQGSLQTIPTTTTHLPRHTSSKEKIPPSGVKDLSHFRESRQGKIVVAVLSAFGSSATFERNQRYDLVEWTTLLEKYYELAIYIVPCPHIEFLPRLLEVAAGAEPEDGIAFATLVQRFAPVIVTQTLSEKLLASWDTYIRGKLESLIRTGQDFPTREEPDNYDYGE
jgi:hypothetical protein